MGNLTINSVFEYLQEKHALNNPVKGGFRFGRRERVEAVFPQRVCEKIATRSASYYSWFLNMDRQGVPIRDFLRSLFEEDSCEVVREMEEKCEKLFAGQESSAVFGMDVWQGLLDMLGREVPLFVRGSDGAGRLERIAEAAPQRALACLFLVAGMDGLTQAQYEQLLGCWRLMNRSLLSRDAMEPLRRVHAGELLLLDGNRREAVRQMIQAADRLQEELQDPSFAAGSDSQKDTAFLGRVLQRIGEIYLRGGVDGTDETKAQEYLKQAVSAGCAGANTPLAMLEWKNGQIREARDALLRGAEAGIRECLRILGNSFYRGDAIADSRKDLRMAAGYYYQGACPEDTSTGDAVCQYMLGRILEEAPRVLPMGKRADPEYWYAVAARRGNEEAAARLNRLRWYAFGEEGGAFTEDPDPEDRFPEKGRRSPESQEAGGGSGNGQKENRDDLKEPEDRTEQENLTGLKSTINPTNLKEPEDLKEPKGWTEPVNPAEKICLLNSRSETSLLFAGSLPENTFRIIFCTGTPEGDSVLPVGIGSLKFGVQGPRKEPDRPDQEIPEGKGGFEIYPGTMAQALHSIGRDSLDRARGRGAQALLDSFPDILCAAFDDREEKNIQDGLQILREAFLLHERSGLFVEKEQDSRPDWQIRSNGEKEPGWKNEPDRQKKSDGKKEPDRQKDPEGKKVQEDRLFYLLSDRVKLYVTAGGESAAPVFDSAFSRLGDFYLPLYLCDRAKMASAWLLDRLPLFIPCLGNRGGKKDGVHPMNVTIFGDHPGIVQLCKDMFAAAQIEDAKRFPFSMTVVGVNADQLEERFLADCPGIADPPEDEVLETPVFVRMDPRTRRFQALLEIRPAGVRTHEEEQLAQRLQAANYIIVYSGEEDGTLPLAMYLREWYLRTDPSFTRLPFITVYCEKRERAEQLRTLTAGAESAGSGWNNNYQIEAFGRTDQLFTYEALVENRLEQRALASHFAYYTFTTQADRFRAEHDYFSRYHNRDSSLMNALALPYRLFSAGIAFADWHDYTEGISQAVLAGQFENWLEAQDGDRERRLETLAIYEHGRWNRAMYSRGWLPASTDQMLTYIQRGNGRHQLYIAKLHPFLYSWDRLGEAGASPTGIQKEYSDVMRQVRPDREPADIRGIDRENVLRTAGLIRSAP